MSLQASLGSKFFILETIFFFSYMIFVEVYIYLFLQECLWLCLLQPCSFATRIFCNFLLKSGRQYWMVAPVGQKVSVMRVLNDIIKKP